MRRAAGATEYERRLDVRLRSGLAIPRICDLQAAADMLAQRTPDIGYHRFPGALLWLAKHPHAGIPDHRRALAPVAPFRNAGSHDPDRPAQCTSEMNERSTDADDQIQCADQRRRLIVIDDRLLPVVNDRAGSGRICVDLLVAGLSCCRPSERAARLVTAVPPRQLMPIFGPRPRSLRRDRQYCVRCSSAAR
jgi:hypothetical protein